jgi:hypothetical protein
MLTVMLKFRPAAKVLGALSFMCLMSAAAFAQTSQTTNVEIGNYMVGYYTGANQGLPDAQMHIINPGSSGGFGNADGTPTAIPMGGDLCANIYVFTPDEQMIACCSCKVSPNGMQGFSLATDLTANPLTSILPHAGAIKVVASPGGGRSGNLGEPPDGPSAAFTTGNACDAGSWYPSFSSSFDEATRDGGRVPQLQTWITHVRTLGTPFGASNSVTEIPFLGARLSHSEYEKLVTQCFAIEGPAGRGGVGSGAGLCLCDPSKVI